MILKCICDLNNLIKRGAAAESKKKWIVMKILRSLVLACNSLLFFSCGVVGYHLPTINLGLTNMLDGGPLIPIKGWYWRPYFVNYHATKFTDGCGNLLGGVPSPHFNVCTIITQFLYQSDITLAKGKLGLNFFLPSIVSSRVTKNDIGITSSGRGFGDYLMGVFLQWEPKPIKGEVTFTTRLACDVSFPSGKNEQPCKAINPGNNYYFINPFWAATLHFTTDWAVSWRLHYLWCSQNRATHIQAGDTVHLNYDMEYQVFPKLWIGVTGYFLQQLRDSNLCGEDIPLSRERILGNGFGILYTTKKNYRVLSYLYFENMARNRPQGTRFVFRLIKHF